ncbi:hypothetical protein HK099_002830, partial [Clydaea vesicula]
LREHSDCAESISNSKFNDEEEEVVEFATKKHQRLFNQQNSNFKCTHCNCSGKFTPALRKGPLGPRTLCNACGVYYNRNGSLPAHRNSNNLDQPPIENRGRKKQKVPIVEETTIVTIRGGKITDEVKLPQIYIPSTSLQSEKVVYNLNQGQYQAIQPISCSATTTNNGKFYLEENKICFVEESKFKDLRIKTEEEFENFTDTVCEEIFNFDDVFDHTNNLFATNSDGLFGEQWQKSLQVLEQ